MSCVFQGGATTAFAKVIVPVVHALCSSHVGIADQNGSGALPLYSHTIFFLFGDPHSKYSLSSTDSFILVA